jgi:hypothetical protein
MPGTLPGARLKRLGGQPGFLIHDAQLRHFDGRPLLADVEARDASAGVGVPAEGLPVIEDTPRIKVV